MISKGHRLDQHRRDVHHHRRRHARDRCGPRQGDPLRPAQRHERLLHRVGQPGRPRTPCIYIMLDHHVYVYT